MRVGEDAASEGDLGVVIAKKSATSASTSNADDSASRVGVATHVDGIRVRSALEQSHEGRSTGASLGGSEKLRVFSAHPFDDMR